MARNKLITRRELAPRLDVVMQTITGWEQSGMPVAQPGRKGKPSLYCEADVRKWRDEREEAARANGTLDLAQERARKEHTQSLLNEQLYQTRSGELLAREEVGRTWAKKIIGARAILLALPQTYSARIHRASKEQNEAGVESCLKDIVKEVLRELGEGVKAQAPKRRPRKKAPKRRPRKKAPKRRPRKT